MSGSAYKNAIAEILASSDIRIDGDRSWDIRVKQDGFYRRVLAGGSLAFGESYVDGWWECDAIDEVVSRMLRHGIGKRAAPPLTVVGAALLACVWNAQDRRTASRNARAHYDLGNDLYRVMLDKRLVYTCAYWKDAADLDAAQEAKLDLTCRKLGLKPGQRLLDIGCGWGSFLKFAAERYGVSGVGITLSPEQAELGRELCAGLPVEIRVQDYRDVDGVYDRVVSLGMFEHVGPKNYRTYMRAVDRCLKDDGLFLLHTIGSTTTVSTFDPWMAKYVFPHAHLPSMRQIDAASEGIFVTEDWHNFGPDYDKTLVAWNANFEARAGALAARYDDRFRRMWRYYLLACAGSFRSRINHLWQIVYSKHGIPGGHTPIR